MWCALVHRCRQLRHGDAVSWWARCSSFDRRTDRPGRAAWRDDVNVRSDRYLAGLHSAVDRAGVPYGYTVTIWTSGQVLIVSRGTPPALLLPAFAGGAALAYLSLAAVIGRSGDGREPVARAGLRAVWAVGIQLAAIMAAIGAVALVGEAPEGVAWPAGGFVATTVYLCGTATAFAIRQGGY